MIQEHEPLYGVNQSCNILFISMPNNVPINSSKLPYHYMLEHYKEFE